ncbi:MAG: DUF4279 domain-containing protein [Oscillatoria sp. PMC 1051.18]|nr:DUF4279 domain-containing protein [Oscillatoria sp. PMC 1050.18]MEC5033238.1 DUF4279 domain-containing protein [Oscillatoria sp. PMC 1051.18]
MSNRSLATLTITSSTLSPQDITNHLRIKPTVSHKKGTLLNPKNPNSKIRNKSSWLLRSSMNRKDSLEDKINGLTNVIQDNLSLFKQIEKEIDVEIYCSFFLQEESDTFYLPSITITKLSLIPIDIIVTIYPFNGGDVVTD